MLSLKTRKWLCRVLVVCLALATFNGVIIFQPKTASAAAIEIGPEADAQIDGGSGSAAAQENNINTITMNIKEDTNATVPYPYTRRVFMRFDLSTITDPNTISEAKLRIYATGGTAVTTQVYAVSDDTWGETTIKWVNKPAYGAAVGSIEMETSASGIYYEADLTGYIKSQVEDGKASIMLMNPPNGTQRTINSRENTANKPVLVITTDTAPPVYQSAAVSSDYREITLNFNENVLLNAGASVKERLLLARDGSHYSPLGADDAVSIANNQVIIALNDPLSGNANRIQLAANSLKDAAGNVLASEVTAGPLTGAPDLASVNYVKSYLQSDGKTFSMVFDRDIAWNTGDAGANKARFQLSADGGATYGSLGANDMVAINAQQAQIHFASPLQGDNFKVRLLADTVKGAANGVIYHPELITAAFKGIVAVTALPVSADAYVDAGSGDVTAASKYYQNFGAVTPMALKEDIGASQIGRYTRRIFLKFNVADTGAFNNAKLRLYFSVAGPSEPLTLYAVNNDSWAEGAITYENQPAYAEWVATASTDNGNGWYEWDVTDYVNREKLSDGLVSLVLIGTTENRSVVSRESSTNAPYLNLTFDIDPPQYTGTVVSNENKTLEMSFNEPISNNLADMSALKSAITLARDGSAFQALGAGDQISIDGPKLKIALASRLNTAGAKLSVAANALRDNTHNVLGAAVTTAVLDYDVTAPVLRTALQVDSANKIFVIAADEAIYNNLADAAALKNVISFSTDGIVFAPLAAGDQADVSGGTLTVTRTEQLSGGLNRLRIAGNTLKDLAGNIVTGEYTSDAVSADTAAPFIQSVSTADFNKKVVVTFNEPISSNLADAAALKNAVKLSADGGASYRALGEKEKVILSGAMLTLVLDNSITGNENKVNIAQGTVKDLAGNIAEAELTTSAFAQSAVVYPYLPTRPSDLSKAMNDTVNIAFGNKDAAEGSGTELTNAKGFSFLAEEIALGNRQPQYIQRFVSTVKKMISTPANMPNLQAGLDSRGHSPMLYGLALLWNDQEIMSHFSPEELSKLNTMWKAALISSAYTLSEYNELGNLRAGDRVSMNGDTNNWIGTGVNYWEPNLTLLYTASFILGLENVKSILQNYDHIAFIDELNAQGLSTIRQSFEKTANFSTAATEAERLAEKADKIKKVITSSKWSFKGVTMDQFLENPLRLHKATQDKSWTHPAQDGDYMGQMGMGHEFDTTDSKGSRQSASYTALGIDPSLQNTRLMKYYGFMDAPGNAEMAASIAKLQQVGVSDYYAKTINGYFTQSSYEVATSYLGYSFFISSMISMGYLKPALFNDTFNYDGVKTGIADNWILKGGSWSAVNDSIIPYNTKDPINHMPDAKPVDPQEKLLKQDSAAAASALAYTKQSYGNVSYLAWLKDSGGGEAGILAGVQDENNYYQFSYSSGKLFIKKKVAGNLTILAEKDHILSAAAHRFRAVLNGGSIVFYVDGVQQLEAADTTFTAGAVGLFSASTQTKFDGILVQNSSIAAPEIHSLTIGNGKLSLKFSEVAGATGYRVKYGTAPGVYTSSIVTMNTEPVLTGLANDTVYYVAVSAVDPNGESANSAELSMAPRVPTAATPEITSLIADGNRILVNFTTNPVNASYTIKYGVASGNYAYTVTGVTDSGYAVTVPASQAPYYFVVEGVNDYGASVPSAERSGMANSPVMFSDDFNDGEFASNWFLSNGSPTIENGKLKTGNGNPERMWLNQGDHWKDYTVTAKFTLAPEDATKEVAILARINTSANYYVAEYKYDKATNTEKAMLRRKVNNAFLSDAGFTVDFPLRKDIEEHTMKASFEGSRIRLYIDDVLAYDLEDNALTTGTAGIFSVIVPVYFDDFQVELLNGLAKPAITGITAAAGKATAVFGAVDGAEGYRIKYGTESRKYTHELDVSGALSSGVLEGLQAEATYYVAVSAYKGGIESENSQEVSVVIPGGNTGSPGGSGNSGDTGSSSPASAPPAVVVTGNKLEVAPTLQGGSAKGEITAELFNQALQAAAADSGGRKQVVIELKPVDGARQYVQQLPAQIFTAQGQNRQIQLKTGIAHIVLPGTMFNPQELADVSKIGIVIGEADKGLLDPEVRQKLGNKPVIELKVQLDGTAYEWKNNGSPVTVAVDYAPTAEELQNPEHIVVWHLDAAGEIVRVPSGRYDPQTGKITFSAAHLNTYAVAYEVKTFDDLAPFGWAKKPIEVLASKGIIEGVAERLFAPGAAVTRADFMALLVRTLELQAEAVSSFDDVHETDYYYSELAVAKALGIAQGTGANRFNPTAAITREDMIVLATRALAAAGKLKPAADAADLNQFGDASLISDYAASSVAALVQQGLIEGSGALLQPKSNTLRAEVAMLMYRIYNQ